jgi:hypothetical protein
MREEAAGIVVVRENVARLAAEERAKASPRRGEVHGGKRERQGMHGRDAEGGGEGAEISNFKFETSEENQRA